MRKMSTLFREKSSSDNFFLPPSVNGKKHGYCDFVIEDICWKTTKTYPNINAHIKWWGSTESEGILFHNIATIASTRKLKSEVIKQKSSPVISVRYQINTNQQLFQSYLKNCDPIIVQIFSSKTSDLIGTARISIPKQLYHQEKYSSSKVSSQIISKRNFSLGELVASFNINFNMLDFTQSIKTVSEKENLVTTKSVRQVSKVKSSNKENIEIIGNKKIISMRNPKPVKQTTLRKAKGSAKPVSINHDKSVVSKKLNSLSSSSISSDRKINSINSENSLPNSDVSKTSTLRYLSGLPLSKLEENRILKDIVLISPSQSVMEELNRVDLRQQVKSNVREKRSILDRIDSIQIIISTLELNTIGLVEVNSFINKQQDSKYVVKCVITSKLFDRKEDLHFISPVFDSVSQKLIFNKELSRNIQKVQIDESMYFNFGFCIKSINHLQQSPHILGFTRINLLEVFKSKFKFHKACPVIDENNMKIGMVILKINLHQKDIFQLDNQSNLYRNISISDNSIDNIPTSSSRLLSQKYHSTSHPSTSNDDCDNHGDRQYENKNIQTDANESNASKNLRKGEIDDNQDTEMIDIEQFKENKIKHKIFQGILFIEGLRNIKEKSSSEFFITYEGFWNECQEMTDVSVSSIFNYLKQFPIMCDDAFLKRVQNNHLELKLWEKTFENSEKWIASTKVPLHQFYIAFKDVAMIEHLSLNKLPIISTDTWCNFISPLSNELYCQVKILLAIGNENQIDYLKLSRNLHNLQPLIRHESYEPQSQSQSQFTDTNVQIKNKLSAFIESLSQKLPEPTNEINIQQKISSVSSTSSRNSNSQPQMRKTSDLLDTLQKALSQPAPSALNTLPDLQHQSSSDYSTNSHTNDNIQMVINIEHANNIPKIIVKKNRNKRKSKGTTQRFEYEPHVYVTFEASTENVNESLLPQNIIKSHEGIVYCTKVVKSTSPEWNERFNVFVPLDVIKNPQKKFVLKVWRKTLYEPTKIEPAPFEDTVIGFSAIDLSVLLTGLPTLSGYYSIVDFSGRSNGQIKVSFEPLDDINKFRNPGSPLVHLNPLMCSLKIDIDVNPEGGDGSALLSRTLKRKFTELDEITQRLKARLFDVTGDNNFDPDEEFEKDLNTVADEMEEENFSNEDFAWLGTGDNNGNVLIEQTNSQSDLNKIIESQPSTSKERIFASTSNCTLPSKRQISGCSSSDEAPPRLAIDELLKKYDLDSIINPNIFKNILDPLTNSDSTPTLNANTNEEQMNSCESADTTVSSIISSDQVQTIQNALQRASLQENSEQSSIIRKDPDGQNENIE